MSLEKEIELLEKISDQYINIKVLEDGYLMSRSVIPLGVVTKKLGKLRYELNKKKRRKDE